MPNINYIGFDEIPSTNAYALENIQNIEDKSVVFANTQTQGRGRFKRTWISENCDNLYFSIILKPTENLQNDLPLANLTQYMSLILCELIDSYGIKSQIKWPNDVLVDNKKIAGILAESSIKKGLLQGIVLGVGINLNSKPEDIAKIDQKATSLNIEINNLAQNTPIESSLQKKIDKELFLREIISRFFDKYDDFLSMGFTMIKNNYTQKCSFLGSTITIKEPDSSYDVIADSVLDDGTLCVKIGNNKKIIKTGDILLG